MKWTSVRINPTNFIWWSDKIPPVLPPPFERGGIGCIQLSMDLGINTEGENQGQLEGYIGQLGLLGLIAGHGDQPFVV